KKDFLNIDMVDLATATSVLRQIFEHRQQSAIGVGTGDDLNVYAGEASSCHHAVEFPANVWRPACVACCVYKGGPMFGGHRLDDHHWPIAFDGVQLAACFKHAPELAYR